MRTEIVCRWNALLLALLAIAGAVFPGSAEATTRTVLNLNDAGAGSLRDIIAASVADDAIDFSVTGTITLTGGELAISRNLTIIGPAGGVTVSGNNASRVFNISSATTVSIFNLAIRNGRVTGAAGVNGSGGIPAGPGADAQGGGILNQGTLSLINCTLNNNSANGGFGGFGPFNASGNGGAGGAGNSGAIANLGTLNLVNCALTSNAASGGHGGPPGLTGGSGGVGGDASSGAIANQGTLNLTDCALSNNSANGGGGADGFVSAAGGAARGGAILNQGTLNSTNCTTSTNSANGGAGGHGAGGGAASGGGIHNVSAVTLVSCTISGNAATGGDSNSGNAGAGGTANGGGIHNLSAVTLVDCTFSGNSATGGNGASGFSLGGNGGNGIGGGLYQPPAGGTTSVHNTIIAGDSATGGSGGTGSSSNGSNGTNAGPDITGVMSSQGHNFIGKTNNSSGWMASDFTGSIASPLNPQLGPLQNNGGPTFTLALLPGSAAIDRGDDAVLNAPFNLATDQRGRPRKSGAHVDIGAFELGLATVLVSNTNDSGAGSLRQAILYSSPSEGDTIAFASNVTGVIALQLGQLAIDHDLRIVGPGAMTLAISGSHTSRVFNVTAGTVFISGLAITNGRVTGLTGSPGQANGGVGGVGGDALGGGLYNNATLTVSNCWIVGNGAAGGVGGADDANNPAGTGGTGGVATGGGIYNNNLLTLVNCAVSGNSSAGGLGGNGADPLDNFPSDAGGAGGAGGSGTGGGVCNNGILNVTNCTLSGNSAAGGAGAAGRNGIADGPGGAGGAGGTGTAGGLANLNNLHMSSCTISLNLSSAGAGGPGGSGRLGAAPNGSAGTAHAGGLQSSTTLNFFQNTLNAANSADSLPDCEGNFTSLGFNLVGITNGASGFTAAGDQAGSLASPINPVLGSLQNNGGPTPTMALLSGSPAIDKGNSFGLATDQRGSPRPFDFASVANASGSDGSDIGAFELNPPLLSITRVANNVVLFWPASAVGFRLQSVPNLAASNNWTSDSGTPSIIGSQFYLTNTASSGMTFYRLIFP